MHQCTETSLADLATHFPGASRRFQDLGLDYCCGGRRPLSEACRERGLDAAALLEEIQTDPAGADATRWDARPLPELIEHIVTRYHEPLRAEMPKLIAMARKVEFTHAEKDTAPRGLTDHLAMMAESLEDHMQKEEQVLFPLVASGRGTSAAVPVRVLTQEHEDHAFNLQLVRELTDGLTPPEEACTTWRALCLRLRELEREVMEHVHLENNVLFPRALQSESTTSETLKKAR